MRRKLVGIAIGMAMLLLFPGLAMGAPSANANENANQGRIVATFLSNNYAFYTPSPADTNGDGTALFPADMGGAFEYPVGHVVECRAVAPEGYDRYSFSIETSGCSISAMGVVDLKGSNTLEFHVTVDGDPGQTVSVSVLVHAVGSGPGGFTDLEYYGSEYRDLGVVSSIGIVS